MNFKFNFLLCFFIQLVSLELKAQDANLSGTVKDSTGKPIEAVSVSIVGESGGALSDMRGRYSIKLTPYKDLIIAFSNIGCATEKISIKCVPGEQRTFDVILKSNTTSLGPVQISGTKAGDLTTIRIEPKTIEMIPSASGNFEGVLKTLPGVVSNNELSSTYSVRGGNFDENLVYVNDIEINRPFLVRSGQQEGLTFINGALVSDINFSAGGFGAKYGDRMSSVLDVKYKKPKQFGGSFEIGFLGASIHLEGASKNERFTYLFGYRRKSNQFLLEGLDTQGDYRPSFTDVQGLATYKLSTKTEISVLANYARNEYKVIPSSRETEFGSINEALKFTVYFSGQEVDNYRTSQGAITLNHKVNDNLQLKLIGSSFITREEEFFDIAGQYYLDELERDLGSDNFGSSAFNRGVGANLDHARNELSANVKYIEHKGYYNTDKINLQWGARFQHEKIVDELDEWQYIDSADFSIPHPQDNPGGIRDVNQQIVLNNVIKNNINLSSNRVSGYLQNGWLLNEFNIVAGIRATFFDLNQELNISPRISASYQPLWNKRLTFRLATGIYYQPPFYRELRGLNGQINENVKAQKSVHLVAATDYQFLAWGREFKLTTEAYYKKLDDLNPYKVENTRINYLAKNNAAGYAAGLDLRVNGEFVSGVESWASLSFLKTVEDLNDDFYYNYFNSTGELIIPGYTFNDVAVDSTKITPGNIPKPTDQRVTFSLLFQDYLPKNPSYKMHLNLIFGTGLPFGPPGPDRYKDILRGPTYRRVDIGFSKTFIDEDTKNTSRIPVIKNLKSFILSLEVFNLLQVSNTVSYTWITDVNGTQYAVPNYLTSRLLNLRIATKF